MTPNKKKNHLAIVGLFIVVFIMSISLLAVMFLKKPVSELSLDTRKEAMVDSGLVELDTYPFNQSTLKVKEEQKINLQINTKDKSVDAVELIFEVIADEGLLDKSKIKFTGTIPEELEVGKQEIIDSVCSKDCYTVTLLLNIKDSNQAFATHDQMATISQLSFTPQKEGSLKIKISQDSTAIEHESSSDVLQKPSVLDFQYYVTNNGIDPSQCYYQYTSWGDCNNGWQTRQYSVEPDNCYWYEKETLKELSQKCVDSDAVSANNSYFYLYSTNNCFNQATTGENFYIIWNDDKYDNVTWIDVSTSNSFSNFYHKKVEGNIDQTNGDWLMVNAKGFTDATDERGTLIFEPDEDYYFRLYSTDNDGQHISSVHYYVAYCSGDQSVYKNCNDACGANSDQGKSCAPGMTCYEGSCRNENNPSDSSCLPILGTQLSNQSCNQYCASNNDCSAGLSCYWNSCRNPLNLSNTSCSVTTTYSSVTTSKSTLLPSEAYDLSTYSCNHGCNNNRDCEADMRCYKGSCRLADDPENIACVVSATELNSKDASSSSSVAKIVKPSTTPITDTNSKDTQSGLNKFLSSFSWQWLAIAGVILLVAISLIISSIAKAKKDPWTNHIKMINENDIPQKPEPEKTTETIKIPEDKPLQL
ncbi:hypothetical protein KKI22_04330 [Patescibacteria group bacterium]|nr:hypothetical protein [Patescibacteria group bacterium]